MMIIRYHDSVLGSDPTKLSGPRVSPYVENGKLREIKAGFSLA